MPKDSYSKKLCPKKSITSILIRNKEFSEIIKNSSKFIKNSYPKNEELIDSLPPRI